MHRFSKWGLKREPFVRLCCPSKKHTSLSCTRLLDTRFFIISLTMANCFMISKCFAIFCTSLQLRQTSQRANFSQFCGPSHKKPKKWPMPDRSLNSRFYGSFCDNLQLCGSRLQSWGVDFARSCPLALATWCQRCYLKPTPSKQLLGEFQYLFPRRSAKFWVWGDHSVLSKTRNQVRKNRKKSTRRNTWDTYSCGRLSFHLGHLSVEKNPKHFFHFPRGGRSTWKGKC